MLDFMHINLALSIMKGPQTGLIWDKDALGIKITTRGVKHVFNPVSTYRCRRASQNRACVVDYDMLRHHSCDCDGCQ